MKKQRTALRSVVHLSVITASFLVVWSPAQAQSNPIRQRQQNHLLGHSVRIVNRDYGGIGAASGLLTNARVITKASHATPDFILEGPPYTTTPVHLRTGVASPNNYGVPGNLEVRILVQINNTYITVNPFETPRANALHQVRQAQRRWLRDNGYIGAARMIRRVDVSRGRADGLVRSDDAESNTLLVKQKKALPTPRATIEIHPGMQKTKIEMPALEASVESTEPQRVVLGDRNLEMAQAVLAASINGTITVKVEAQSTEAEPTLVSTK